jgi:hypothetical protein
VKWFKHLSGSLNDNLIFNAIEDFGSDAYLVFFGILEMMADEFDYKKPGECSLSYKKVTKNLQLSRQKTVRILKYFDQKAKENRSKNTSFFVEFGNKHFVVKCPKFSQLVDNYNQKLIGDMSKETSKSLRSNLRKNYPIEEEAEEETYKESRKRDFLNNHYKNKTGNFYEKIKTEIENIKKLKPEKPEFKPEVWVQVQVNEGGHPKAILETLQGLSKNWNQIEGNPWGYANKSILTKSQNYHEQDHILESQKFKQIWMKDNEIQEIIGRIF